MKHKFGILIIVIIIISLVGTIASLLIFDRDKVADLFRRGGDIQIGWFDKDYKDYDDYDDDEDYRQLASQLSEENSFEKFSKVNVDLGNGEVEVKKGASYAIKYHSEVVNVTQTGENVEITGDGGMVEIITPEPELLTLTIKQGNRYDVELETAIGMLDLTFDNGKVNIDENCATSGSIKMNHGFVKVDNAGNNVTLDVAFNHRGEFIQGASARRLISGEKAAATLGTGEKSLSVAMDTGKVKIDD